MGDCVCVGVFSFAKGHEHIVTFRSVFLPPSPKVRKYPTMKMIRQNHTYELQHLHHLKLVYYSVSHMHTHNAPRIVTVSSQKYCVNNSSVPFA